MANRLAHLPIDWIVSSPFLRAAQSIAPLAERLSLPITTDPRLTERILSATDLVDWETALRATFDDLDLCFAGGESSRTAMRRAIAVIDEVKAHAAQCTVVVTHGNLMTLLLKHFEPRFGFAEWQALTNPDVYRIELHPDDTKVLRIMESNSQSASRREYTSGW